MTVHDRLWPPSNSAAAADAVPFAAMLGVSFIGAPLATWSTARLSGKNVGRRMYFLTNRSDRLIVYFIGVILSALLVWQGWLAVVHREFRIKPSWLITGTSAVQNGWICVAVGLFGGMFLVRELLRAFTENDP